MKKTVLLTGATGNMGMAGLRELLKETDDRIIRLLARDSRANRKKLKFCENNPDVQIVWGDLMDYSAVLRAVNGADYVLHVGGMVSPAADYFPEKTLKVNVGAARNIVRAIMESGQKDTTRLVYIGSVAQCGDRLAPVHWGRAGDPVYASSYDKYSVSKCEAERIIVESGIRWWVSLRQTGIMYPGIINVVNATAFHVPIRGVLEWATVEDSGRLLARVTDSTVPDAFWNRFYNISSGEEYRLTNYQFEQLMLGLLGLGKPEQIFEPQWFATRNFHGMWYTDADELEAILHFRANIPIVEYCRMMKSQLPWFYSLARFVPSAKFVKMFMKPYAFEKGMGTQWWVDNDKDKLEAFYGSEENYRSIKSWKQMIPPPYETNLSRAEAKGEARRLDHGYDESKSIYELTVGEIEKTAEFRGGKFLGMVQESDKEPVPGVSGKKGTQYLWECECGHRFTASLEYVLLGGGWCSECPVEDIWKHVTPRNRFMYQLRTGL